MNANLESSIHISNASVDPINWLFGQLHGMFGNKFLDGWRSGHVIDGKDTGIENMKAIWADRIRANGLRLSDVRKGIEGAERLRWPPTWGEFIELCKPSICVDAALYEAIQQMQARQKGKDRWSNPAIYWAAVAVGEYDVMRLTFSQLKPRFEIALRKVLASEVLPVPERFPTLVAPGASESSREFARRRLDELLAMPLIDARSKGASIDWARRIIEREMETGTVPRHKLDIAKEAILKATGQPA
ncbi:hypothetical protein G3N95_35025 [Paraburkholderia sp. Tr-20389]|uniref:hypothetical protein n=1 Tax=Paraburkholderia sp. Tr-20389 TaxID=2703903 RepID=UPI00197E4FA0|nr:hypothetical protein [Paraburkholderia sp. Tr-20389]MBN3758174.1 hypothetical protein [Paraburkholderia sp. Tr-20389]